ncbi:hypothetical protein EJ04DRAFT_597716 [Polyplosphaeria fusca]|uniref:Uncharacterized protein n=1 Tax=Polyplosphaeria fusca TaxID=682080 RepID=A0A9P4R850_9PLEO|nr:hypothetical protein EJ04DRAFT_597716 [Polyplosphaeria fusca]
MAGALTLVPLSPWRGGPSIMTAWGPKAGRQLSISRVGNQGGRAADPGGDPGADGDAGATFVRRRRRYVGGDVTLQHGSAAPLSSRLSPVQSSPVNQSSSESVVEAKCFRAHAQTESVHPRVGSQASGLGAVASVASAARVDASRRRLARRGDRLDSLELATTGRVSLIGLHSHTVASASTCRLGPGPSSPRSAQLSPARQPLCAAAMAAPLLSLAATPPTTVSHAEISVLRRGGSVRNHTKLGRFICTHGESEWTTPATTTALSCAHVDTAPNAVSRLACGREVQRAGRSRATAGDGSTSTTSLRRARGRQWPPVAARDARRGSVAKRTRLRGSSWA